MFEPFDFYGGGIRLAALETQEICKSIIYKKQEKEIMDGKFQSKYLRD